MQTAPGQVETTVGNVPRYDHLFTVWLHARRVWIADQGCLDPLLVGIPSLAQVFDTWLQQRWPSFYTLHIGAPDNNQTRWFEIFDQWIVTLLSDTSSVLAIPSPASAPSASQGKKNYRNEMSALTVQQIQHSCTVAGGDAGAIQRLALVFPLGSAITREALKIGWGRGMGHHGYQEFSVLVNGWWCCQLCNMSGRRKWKNVKDILNHVWNEHCDPRLSR